LVRIQTITLAECVGFSGQLFLLWLVELEIHDPFGYQYFSGLLIWFFGSVPKQKKSQILFMAEHH
jgi:hypothetical protein